MKKNSIGYTINHDDNTIIMTKAFAKQANIYGTKEYQTLVGLLHDLTGYKATIKTIAVSDTKQTYEGLTFEKMREHIIYTRDDETAEKLLEEMNEREIVGKRLGCKYGYVKKWFLKVCEDYKDKKKTVALMEEQAA